MGDLELLRREIEEIDDNIIKLLGARFSVINKIGLLKAKNALPTVIPERIAVVKQRVADRGLSYNLDPAFLKNLYQLIIDEAIVQEEKLARQ